MPVGLLFTFHLQTNFEMSGFIHDPLKRYGPAGPKNVKVGHVTLTTPTWGTISHHMANTSRGQLVDQINSKSLAVAVAEIFQGV